MTDHAEEQEMEAEALQAIFDTHFTILEPQKWQIEIYPEMTADPDELHQLNHVGVHLIAELPSDYPEVLPKLDCQIVKGLVEEHRQELLTLAQEEAAANEGVPSIFAIAERLREWLAENNQKGLDDLSMHAQMLRKQHAKEKEVSNDLTIRFQTNNAAIRTQNCLKNVTYLLFQESWQSSRVARIESIVVKILPSIGVVADRRRGDWKPGSSETGGIITTLHPPTRLSQYLLVCLCVGSRKYKYHRNKRPKLPFGNRKRQKTSLPRRNWRKWKCASDALKERLVPRRISRHGKLALKKKWPTKKMMTTKTMMGRAVPKKLESPQQIEVTG